MSKTIAQWNPFDGLVDGTLPEEYIEKFATGETCAVAVGHPILSQNTSITDFTLVGSMQQITVSQNKQLRFVWEMGGSRGTIVPGRVSGTLGMTKMLLHGQSILKALYSFVSDAEIDALARIPGYGDFWLNLASQLFNRPLGLGFIMRNLQNSQYATYFFEATYIGSHQFGMGSQTMVAGENVSTRYEAIKPLPLIGSSAV